RAPAATGPRRRAGAPRGVLGGRQPGSRVQVPGEQMTATDVATRRRSRSAELSALAALFMLTVRQHTHGRRVLVLGLLYLLPCVLALILRNLSRPAPADTLEFALVFTLLPHGLAPLTALLYA